MDLRTITLSLQGKSRENNEDSYYADSKMNLLLVADGMGGYQAGEVASAMAVKAITETISEYLAECSNLEDTIVLSKFEPEEVLRSAFYYANQIIYSRSQEDVAFKNMGSTLTVAWFFNETLYIGHVGDSRAYFFGEVTKQLTCDHSVTGELLREGGITQAEAEKHPIKHMLTRALGAEPRVEVDVYQYPWQKDALLLLCSDGLSGALNLEEVLAKIDVTKDKTQILTALVTMAVELGSLDDITAILAWHKVLEEKPPHSEGFTEREVL